MELAGVISGAVGTVVSLITLLILLFRGVFSLEHRLTRLETQMEPLWGVLQRSLGAMLRGNGPAGNPISQQRWEDLLKKFEDNTLSAPEARELKCAMEEKREEARKENDKPHLLVLTLAIEILGARIQRLNR